MAVLTHLKKDMDFYKNLFALLKVLKGIAVAQYQILERKTKSFSKFSYAVNNFLEGIDISTVSHPLLNPQTTSRAVIAVTSDTGLLGGLNMQVAKLAFEEMRAADDVLYIVGERGKMYAREEHIPYTGFPGITDETRLELALTMRDHVLEKVLAGQIGGVSVIYPVALSLTVQRIEKIVPLPYAAAGQKQQIPRLNLSEFIQESALTDIVEYLVFLWLGEKFYEILGQARLAEMGARFIHLEESSQRLEDLDKKLKLQYFRVKHELTDRSMREIFAARTIYVGKH